MQCAIQQAFIEQLPAHIAVFDCDMRYVAVSRRFLADMASLFSTRVFTPEEVIGRVHYETFPDMPPHWRDIHARVLAGEELAREEDFLRRDDGRPEWARWSMKPWRAADGRIGGALLFSEVITEQVEAQHALAENEARFRATFENAPVGIVDFSPDHRLLRANAAFCSILGYPLDELVNKSLQDITCRDDLPAQLARIEQMRQGEIEGYELEKRYLRKDGTIVWCRLTVSAVRNCKRSAEYYVGVVQDISERRRAEEHIHLLMREINHRAKNMLSVVQAIAHQTATREPEAFIERFSERLQALAANQNLLVRNEWRGVDVDDLARAQLAPFADLIGSRIAVDGPKLHLNATAAQTLGLVLHELATNAGKYGALSTEAGRVDIRWAMRDGDAFTLSWIERDGPPVFPPSRRGFGTVVLEAMTRHSVRGAVDLDYAASGVTWRLTCPAANVLERTAMTPCEFQSNRKPLL